jgi:hypothetical protein
MNFLDLIEETQKNRKSPYKRIHIGNINDEAQKRIENICGVKISEIDIVNSGIIHAIKARRDATAKRPSVNVQNESPRADD